jgi:hypothetical protein
VASSAGSIACTRRACIHALAVDGGLRFPVCQYASGCIPSRTSRNLSLQWGVRSSSSCIAPACVCEFIICRVRTDIHETCSHVHRACTHAHIHRVHTSILDTLWMWIHLYAHTTLYCIRQIMNSMVFTDTPSTHYRVHYLNSIVYLLTHIHVYAHTSIACTRIHPSWIHWTGRGLVQRRQRPLPTPWHGPLTSRPGSARPASPGGTERTRILALAGSGGQ